MSSGAALDLNDARLEWACNGEVRAAGPAYALMSGGTLTLGELARRAARLEPLNIDNRFWHELSDRPLSQPAAAERSRADLAYAQLNQLWGDIKKQTTSAPERVVCAVAAGIRAPQLGLILSIARECGMPLSAFLDSAVATASGWAGQGRFVYIDTHLHQTVAVAVDVGQQVRRERYEAVPRAGLLALYDGWMSLVSRLFVARTRFDPLLQASTEQALFDKLPQLLEQLAVQDEAQLEMTSGADTHRVMLRREEFLANSKSLYAPLVAAVHRLRRAGHSMTIAFSAGSAALPGLLDSFAEFHDCEIVSCVPGAAALAAAEHAQEWALDQNAANLLVAAPRLSAAFCARHAPVKLRGAEASAAVQSATHVLYRGQAYALTPEPIVLGLSPGVSHALQLSGASAGISRMHCSLLRGAEGAAVIDYSRHGSWLNDERIRGRAPLRAGDRLRVGTPGITLEFIAIGGV